MVCGLLGARQLPDTLRKYNYWAPYKKNSVECESKYNDFFRENSYGNVVCKLLTTLPGFNGLNLSWGHSPCTEYRPNFPRGLVQIVGPSCLVIYEHSRDRYYTILSFRPWVTQYLFSAMGIGPHNNKHKQWICEHHNYRSKSYFQAIHQWLKRSQNLADKDSWLSWITICVTVKSRNNYKIPRIALGFIYIILYSTTSRVASIYLWHREKEQGARGEGAGGGGGEGEGGDGRRWGRERDRETETDREICIWRLGRDGSITIVVFC